MRHSTPRIRGREHYGDTMPIESRAELVGKIKLNVERKALPKPG